MANKMAEFTKDNLKSNMVVELRDGRKAVVSVNTIFDDCILFDNKQSHDGLQYYNADLSYVGLTSSAFTECGSDIIKVWKHALPTNDYLLRPSNFSKLIEKSTCLIWERVEPPIEMTVAEIEKKLGIRNLKIVK